MSEDWRTDEPEVGQLAKIPKHGCIYECIEIGPGQKVWTNHAGYIWEMFPNLYQWKPITTPEEQRLKAEVERLRAGIAKHKDALAGSNPINKHDTELWGLIETEAGGADE